MKKWLLLLWFLPCAVWAQNIAAPALAYVSALQPPVWIVVNGEQTALSSSAPIPSGATLFTGTGGRLHVVLADGSLIKLSENTSLNLGPLQLRAAKPKDVLSATLKLTDGRLRYSAGKTSASIRTELTLQVGNALSAQVAVADVYADLDAEAQRLALLSGSLSLTPAQKPALTLAQANTVYTVYRKTQSATDGVTAIGASTLPLTEVEFDQTHPALQSNGPYRIVLARYAEAERAEERVRRYTALGYAVALLKPTAAAPVFRVVLDGFSTADDAQNFAALLKSRLQIVNPLVESLMPTAP